MKAVEKLTSEMIKGIPLGESVTFKLPNPKAINNAQKMCTWTRDTFPELGVEKFSVSRDKRNMTLTVTAVPLKTKS